MDEEDNLDDDDARIFPQYGFFRPNLHLVGEPSPPGFIGAISDLAPLHQQCMRMRWGYDNGIQCTLAEVAEKFGLDQRIVRKLDLRTIRAMRRNGTLKSNTPPLS
jgi:hypothetical protein